MRTLRGDRDLAAVCSASVASCSEGVYSAPDPSALSKTLRSHSRTTATAAAISASSTAVRSLGDGSGSGAVADC